MIKSILNEGKKNVKKKAISKNVWDTMDTMDCGLVSVGANPFFPHLPRKKQTNKQNQEYYFFSLSIKSAI